MQTVSVAVLALALASAPVARAESGSGVDWLWGGGFHAGAPTGEFERAADEGYGLAGHFSALPHGLPIGVRGEVSALVYGSRSFEGQGPDGCCHDTLRTDTWFGNLLLGPELRLRSGGVRPYVHALAGLGYFATTSESDGYYGAPGPETTHYDDTTFAWAAGGGVELAVGRSTALDFAVRYLANDTVDYFTEAQIVPGGAMPPPHRGKVHVVTFTVGIAFGR